VLELDLDLTSEQALDECRRRGLVVRSERELAGHPGSHHWHLRIPGRPGTLELNEWQSRVWVKVHPLRDGGWATAVSHELATQRAE
jgi:predicted secreted protein